MSENSFMFKAEVELQYLLSETTQKAADIEAVLTLVHNYMDKYCIKLRKIDTESIDKEGMPDVGIIASGKSESQTERRADQIGKIDSKASFTHGRNGPVFAGTNIEVKMILAFLHAGMSTQRILNRQPQLAMADLEAAESFAKEQGWEFVED